MTNKKLQKQIKNKLEQLEKIIEEIRNTDIQADDPEMWDSDYYYNLVEQLKEALKLLEDKNDLELGLCSLIYEYQENNEDYE